MHPSDEKPLTVLKKLLVINNERLEGFQQASEETDVSVLKVLFSRLTETSAQCSEELCREVYKLGGVPPAGGEQDKGEFDRAWKEIRSALNRNDHKALLDSCYVEEFMTYKSYEYALRYFQNHMNSQQIALFSDHQRRLRSDKRKVKNLRDVLLSAA